MNFESLTLFCYCSTLTEESGLPAHVWPGYPGSSQRASAAQEEEEEADDEGAQHLATFHHAGEAEVSHFAGRRADDAVHRRTDGWRPRAAGKEGLPARLQPLSCQCPATKRYEHCFQLSLSNSRFIKDTLV